MLLATSFAGLGLYAELNRRQAVRNFDIALGAGDTLVNDVAERLRPLAGIPGVAAETAEQVLTKAGDVIEKLREVAPHSPAVRDRQAAALRGFAETYRALGKTSKQRELAEGARDIMEKDVVALEPDNATWQRDLAVSYSVLGDALQAQGDPSALDYYRKCQSILERLAAQDPSNTDPSNTRWKRDLVACYSMMGLVLRDQGDVDGALEAWRRLRSTLQYLLSQRLGEVRLEDNFAVGVAAVHSLTEAEWLESDPARSLNALYAYREIVKRLLERDPNNPQRRDELAGIYNDIGDFLSLQRDLVGALQAYHNAQDILELLVADDPRNTNWQKGLARSYQGEGRVLEVQNDLDSALKAYGHAQTALERLAAQDPENAGWKHGLAANYFEIGLTLVTRHDFSSALVAFRTAQKIRKDLHSLEPNNFDWQYDLVLTGKAIGNILFFFHHYEAAMAEYNNSKTILERLGAQDPNNFHVQSSLASNLGWIGIVKGKQGDHVAELQALRDAQAIWEDLSAREPRNPSLVYFIMENHNAIGDALQACGDTDSALAAYREVRSAENRLVPESKSQEIQLSRVEHLLKAQLVRSYQGVGEVLRVQGDFAGALEAYRTAQAIVEPLAEQSLDKSLWQSSLEVSYLGIIHVLSDQGDLSGALKAQRDIKLIHERLAAHDPDNIHLQASLALDHKIIGAMLWEQGDQAGALEALRQWVALLKQQVANGSKNPSELAEALGELSWYYLLNGQFAEAKEAATEGYSVDDRQIWIRSNLACAEMFLGHINAAMDIHRQYRDAMVTLDGQSKRWPELVADKFIALRKAGLESPDMRVIEYLLASKDRE